jgi:hypothetical protein
LKGRAPAITLKKINSRRLAKVAINFFLFACILDLMDFPTAWIQINYLCRTRPSDLQSGKSCRKRGLQGDKEKAIHKLWKKWISTRQDSWRDQIP